MWEGGEYNRRKERRKEDVVEPIGESAEAGPAPGAQPAKPAKKTKCGCHPQLPTALLAASKGKPDDAARAGLIVKWGKADRKDIKAYYRHLKDFGGTMGL